MNVMLLPTIAAAALHEGAHALTARSLGVPIKRLGIGILGPYLVRESGTDLQNLAISVAGPLANLLFVGVFVALAPELHHTAGWFALANFTLGVYNLLPIPASDGRRVLKLLRKAK